MDASVRRFACTACGKCCNRSPEVELSEAAGLADVFVFRLMFRLYTLPGAPEGRGQGSAELFHQKRRLLSAHAARSYSKKVLRDGRPAERVHYLMISALALGTREAACAALVNGRCGIYDRRPLGCRAVPFHYSRPDALSNDDFDAFVSTPGYLCDVSEDAPVVLDGGRIVDAAARDARAGALALAEEDRRWKQVIGRRMKSGHCSLPSLQDVEANAGFAALTTSMRVAWEIAAEEGLLEDPTLLVKAQLQTIERELSASDCCDRATLAEMAVEYRRALSADFSVGLSSNGRTVG
jgi:Fe-S-cluster containining protein